jgi:hypothetical protein
MLKLVKWQSLVAKCCVRNTKFANFVGLYFPHFTTIRNNFNMLFLAVLMDFVVLLRACAHVNQGLK